MEKKEDTLDSFTSLGVKPWLVKRLNSLGIQKPTPIQSGCIPQILAGKDCIGAAKTGSGKTFAFALPMIQDLAEETYGIFALVLTPTHELAHQIGDQFRILGHPFSVCVVTGGSDMMEEALKLDKHPNIVVAMPGRLADHLTGCCTFSLKRIKYLVLDEVDRLFSDSFQESLETIFGVLPQNRQNLLFSATITDAVKESKLLPLNSEKLHVWKETDYQLTVNTLDQHYVVCPPYARDTFLVVTLQKYREQKPSSHIVVFTDTKKECQALSMMLNAINMPNVCLHGYMSQKDRVSALAQFRSNLKCTLVATDVAARGLDIPTIDLVINHKVPLFAKEYIHRVGRTARAGRTGMAITLVTLYDFSRLVEIEEKINTKLTEFPIDDNEVVKNFMTVSVTKREQEMQIDNTKFEIKKKNYRIKRWHQAGVDPEMMEKGFKEMKRERIKKAKLEKLADVQKLQEKLNKNQNKNETSVENIRPRHSDGLENIEANIKDGLRKISKTVTKTDHRFKGVIGKMTKIKRKTQEALQEEHKVGKNNTQKRSVQQKEVEAISNKRRKKD